MSEDRNPAPGALQCCEVESTRIAYFDAGQGSALVLIHGMFGDHLDWEPVLAAFAQRHRVIAPDLPGFGGSAKPDRAYDWNFFTGVLDGLLRQVKAKHVTLVGNSFGGMVAIQYALRYPRRVERLVLVSSGGFQEYSDADREAIELRLGEEVVLTLTPERQRQLFAPMFARQTEHQRRYLDKQDAKLQLPDFPAYAQVLVRAIRLVAQTHLLDRLPEISQPTLLLWGEQDLVIPLALVRQALRRLPQGSLTLLPDCGHMPQLDSPQDFVRAVEGFLRAPLKNSPA